MHACHDLLSTMNTLKIVYIYIYIYTYIHTYIHTCTTHICIHAYIQVGNTVATAACIITLFHYYQVKMCIYVFSITLCMYVYFV